MAQHGDSLDGKDSRGGGNNSDRALSGRLVDGVSNEKIEAQRVDIPDPADRRTVAGRDTELQPGGGLDVVGVSGLPATLDPADVSKRTQRVLAELEARSTANTRTGKLAGISTGKQDFDQQDQRVARTEWFRYELDFRKTQRGFNVTIRKRLKWSNTRYSKQIIKRFCPQLTRKMIDQISLGKFLPATTAALQNGGISDGFIKDLQSRIGRGNGKRRTDLTDYERSLLARIESSLSSGNRGRDD